MRQNQFISNSLLMINICIPTMKIRGVPRIPSNWVGYLQPKQAVSTAMLQLHKRKRKAVLLEKLGFGTSIVLWQPIIILVHSLR